MCIQEYCSGQLAFSFPSRFVFFYCFSRHTERVCPTRATEPTGSLSGHCTDDVVAQQGLSCRQILYFNADPLKYDLAKHVLLCDPALSLLTHLGIFSQQNGSDTELFTPPLSICTPLLWNRGTFFMDNCNTLIES